MDAIRPAQVGATVTLAISRQFSAKIKVVYGRVISLSKVAPKKAGDLRWPSAGVLSYLNRRSGPLQILIYPGGGLVAFR